MERREAEGKDPSKMSTDEEDDGIDNTVLITHPPTSPDPRNARFGQPLSTDYRLKDAQREFEASGDKRTVMWRPGSSPVKSGGDEGGEGNWWSMKWDFETGAGRVDLTKEGGMSQEERQGRVQRGGGLHAVGDQQRATTKTCCNAWTGSQLKKSFRARQRAD